MEKKKTSSTNGASIVGYQHVNANRSVSITMYKTEVQMNHRPHHKTNHIKPNRIETVKYT